MKQIHWLLFDQDSSYWRQKYFCFPLNQTEKGSPMLSYLPCIVVLYIFLGIFGEKATANQMLRFDVPRKFQYIANGETLEAALKTFVTHIGLEFRLESMEASIDRQQLKDRLKGTIAADSYREFLDNLLSDRGLDWHLANTALIVTPQARRVQLRLKLDPSVARYVKKYLEDLGILQRRFGWAELQAAGVVSIDGPPSYLNLVEEALRGIGSGVTRPIYRTFKLNNISVADRTVSFRGQNYTFPGAATVLRRIVKGRAIGNINQSSDALEIGRNPTDLKSEERGERTNLRASRSLNSANDSNFEIKSPPADTANEEIIIDAFLPQNMIIAKGPPEALDMIASVLEKIDKRSPLIEITAVVVDVSSSHLSELGISWSANRTQVLRSSGSVNASLKALEESGFARVVGRPVIVTIENQVGLIDLNQSYHVRVTGERVAEVVPITAGVSLRVTPRIIKMNESGGSRFAITIEIEDGTVSASTTDLPTISRGVLSSQATLDEGQSLLLGGYSREIERNEVERVPILAQIPFIGSLFRLFLTTKTHSNRVFMISLRVIDANGSGS